MRDKIKVLIAILSTVLLGLVQACSNLDDTKFPEVPYPLPKLEVDAGNFKSCGEIHDWVARKSQEWNGLSAAYLEWANRNPPPNGTPVSATAPNAPATPVTNIQVPGVDEPDIVKSSSNEIFFARADSVAIVGSANFQLSETLRFKDEARPRLFYSHGMLVVMTEAQKNETFVRFFRKIGRRWKQIQKLNLPGRYLDARLIENSLVLVGQDRLLASSVPTNLACTDIQKPIVDDYNFDLTLFHRIELDKALKAKTTARVGRADRIFVTKDEVYVFARGYTWFNWDPRLNNDELNASSVISRFNFEDDAVNFASAGFASGQIRNQWAFSEDVSGEYLFIATTYSTPEGLKNRIWSFKERSRNLIVAGSSETFGPREDIRAVRFMGERAFAVTFEKTDPLFSFDLSQPEKPRLLSRLEVPGFSAYLHPLSDNHLLGIGYGAVAADRFSWLSGLQISLFKTDSQGQVSVIAQSEFGGRGSHADVTGDHHAFAMDGESRWAAIPLRIFAPGDSAWDGSNNLEFSGAYVIEPLRGLEPAAKFSHREMIPVDCVQQMIGEWWDSINESMDIRRVIWRDGMFISFSPFGAKIHPVLGSRAADRGLSFGDANRECALLRRRTL